MKLRLEFEDRDLKEMIETYFSKYGFKAKDVEGVCAKFKEIYPEGLKIEAIAVDADDPEPVEEPEASTTPSNQQEPAPSEEEVLSSILANNTESTPLSHSQIVSPEKVLGDEESTNKRSEQEITHILSESEQLKSKS